MSWISALKFWNDEKGPIVTDTANVWMMPRKGTEEYDEVRAVQQGKEIPSKKKEREARNKATMDKALGQLRQVETETKARNVERKKEEQKGKPPKYDENEGDEDDREIAKLKNQLIQWLYKNKDGMTKMKALKYYDENFTPKLNSILSEAPAGAAEDIEEDFFIQFKREIDNVLKNKKSVETEIAQMRLSNDDIDRLMGELQKDVDEEIKKRGTARRMERIEGKSEDELRSIVRKWAKENKRKLTGINKVSKAGLLKFIEEKNITV
jgi:hypothetical protein